jgi:predicted dehydrogenase
LSRRTILVGCGRIGATYADDPVMAAHYRYVSHAQALAAHPEFQWIAAFDRDEAAARAVSRRWNVANLADLSQAKDVDVAVLALPPGERLAALEALPSVHAVLVEKPLGRDRADAEAFVEYCRKRGILVQVNLPRRADATHRNLAEGELARRIGRPQGAFVVYGNGLANNGTHMIDLARWFLGEVRSAQVPGGLDARREGPLEDDINVPFVLRHESGAATFAQPLAFAHYRENMIDIWGEEGRLALLQEGLRIAYSRLRPNRAMQGEHELENDAPAVETTSIGTSLYALYDDLARALRDEVVPASTAENAMRNAVVVDAIRQSAAAGGAPMAL